ncbi:toxin-antitoxin system TumE family protein [Halobacteriaceae archaeon SHR40]|uniref:toxin-antitoxin system TumE family protein n=1 Tax=Halovenus amylolytica TaxID=2500550 RepID=UPI000FE358A8
MVPYETERELTTKDGDYVTHIRVRRTDSDQYPCGYDYALHYGTIDGDTLLRYDNVHEQHKGHERHTLDGTEEIEFPGMEALIRQFEREIEALPP